MSVFNFDGKTHIVRILTRPYIKKDIDSKSFSFQNQMNFDRNLHNARDPNFDQKTHLGPGSHIAPLNEGPLHCGKAVKC